MKKKSDNDDIDHNNDIEEIASRDSDDAIRDAEPAPSGLFGDAYGKLTEWRASLTTAADKYRVLHRWVYNQNTVLLKIRTIAHWRDRRLSRIAAMSLFGFGVALLILPARFFFFAITIHCFTKDMAFRRDPSPFDRFYEAIPVRDELDNVDVKKQKTSKSEAAKKRE